MSTEQTPWGKLADDLRFYGWLREVTSNDLTQLADGLLRRHLEEWAEHALEKERQNLATVILHANAVEQERDRLREAVKGITLFVPGDEPSRDLELLQQIAREALAAIATDKPARDPQTVGKP